MKTEDTGTTVLWALGAVAAVLALGVALVLVRNSESGSVSEIELLRQFSDAGFDAGDFADFPTEEGVSDFESVEEAEASAGYDIPQPARNSGSSMGARSSSPTRVGATS
jgi:hypothetical protein